MIHNAEKLNVFLNRHLKCDWICTLKHNSILIWKIMNYLHTFVVWTFRRRLPRLAFKASICLQL